MRQKLILHIGTHKTGSTTIQNYFYFNRLWLQLLGIYYPKPVFGHLYFPSNHAELRDAAKSEGRRKNARVHPKLGRHDALLGQYVYWIKRSACPIAIMSCEGWSSHLNHYAHRLAPLTQHFDVQVVAFLRRPDYWIERFYSQRVANVDNHETTPFSDFAKQPEMEIYLNNRQRIFGWWADAFGVENVQVIPYEPAFTEFDLFEKFMNAVGIPHGISRKLLLRNRRSNPSLSADQTEAVRRRFELGETVSASEIQQMKRNSSGERAFLTDVERRALLDRAGPDMERIRQLYVRDGRDVMFACDPERV